MKPSKNSIISCVALLLILQMFISCRGMKNSDRPILKDNKESSFRTVGDGTKILVYAFIPVSDFKKTIYIISGITGINHKSEKDIIELLSNNENRVVVIHPRGTGYSEGTRGDTNLDAFIADYSDIIKGDSFYAAVNRKTLLFGHSMSCAVTLEVAKRLPEIDGIILVNPPFRLKPVKGMSPGILNYLKYIGYYLFAPHTPIVNMAGDPSLIEDESDRKESEQRNHDPLLVKYFSMHYMTESKKIMDAMVENARQAGCPLLLLYGDKDMIVDKAGCDEIYSSWKGHNKNYEIINGGSHGKSTVIKGAEIITQWIESI